jgi:hypothetical protein
MFATDVFGYTTKHCKSQALLDELVAIDTWSYALKYLVSDIWEL